MRISHCIITDGKEPRKLDKQIQSIHALGISHYEIIVSGNPMFSERVDLIIPMPSTAKQGRLGALRNACVYNSHGDIVIVTDDDMLFHPGFYEGLTEYVGEWDVMACKILNPDGSRYWDWKIHYNGGNQLMPYDQNSPYQSLTGGVTIMKWYVFDRVQWNSELGFNQMEDVDFTDRLKQNGFKIVMNTDCTITHDANYTQKGMGVFKL